MYLCVYSQILSLTVLHFIFYISFRVHIVLEKPFGYGLFLTNYNKKDKQVGPVNNIFYALQKILLSKHLFLQFDKT
jgi:hypothetical protein